MNNVNSIIKAATQIMNVYQTSTKQNPINNYSNGTNYNVIRYPTNQIQTTNQYYLNKVKNFLFKKI